MQNEEVIIIKILLRRLSTGKKSRKEYLKEDGDSRSSCLDPSTINICVSEIQMSWENERTLRPRVANQSNKPKMKESSLFPHHSLRWYKQESITKENACSTSPVERHTGGDPSGSVEK